MKFLVLFLNLISIVLWIFLGAWNLSKDDVPKFQYGLCWGMLIFHLVLDAISNFIF